MNLDALLADEEEAIVTYALSHPKEGYRRLSYMMLDDDVAYCSPSSVYNVLSERELLCRWKPSRSCGVPVEKPTAPHQRWHTDVMYLWVAGRWYFLVSVIDGFARYLIHWELLTSMKADDVTLVVQRALEKVPGVSPEIVSDNGSQYTSKDFKALIKHFQLQHIQIRIQHPESNGVIERFHRSVRDGLSDQELKDLMHARQIIEKWVAYYNNERLHAGIMYLRPRDYYVGQQQELLEERRTKLENARERRRSINLQRWLYANIREERSYTNLEIAKSPISC
jgi:putative transposase